MVQGIGEIHSIPTMTQGCLDLIVVLHGNAR
jgi:hypothetical protein